MSRSQPAAAEADIDDLIQRRQPGYSLEADFYTRPDVYALDLDAVFGQHWLFCATEAELPEPGDYVTITIGTTSVILVRDDDETVYALHNVCRHRGSRVVEDACGSVGNLVCPYHQWTYGTDGELIFAESTQPGFDKTQFGLKRMPVRSVAGLVFVCLSDEPPTDFEEVAQIVQPYLEPFRIAGLKVAHQTDLEEGGNWKLVMENNRECLHCDVGHPELTSAYFPFIQYSAEDVTPKHQALYERFLDAESRLAAAGAAAGVPQRAHRVLEGRPTGFMIRHFPLDGEGRSFAPGGKQVCTKLIGDVTEPAFGDMSMHFQPNSWFHFCSDHAVVFRVLPIAPDRSIVRTTWLVHPEAQEGVDYTIESLTSVWKATNDQDRTFVEKAQRGAADPAYQPGPYGTVEDDCESFVTWYIERLRDYRGHPRLGLVGQASGQ